jgi:DNA-binding NarL/FixJ family response regulator
MKILIVEDHPLVREVLHSVAREAFGEPLIDMAGSFAEAAQKARAADKLDLVLLDLGLPDCGGIDTFKRFRRLQSGARVVVFSEIDDPSCVIAAMEGGACGFLPKTMTRPVILAALQLVAAGGIYMPPQVMGARGYAASRRRRRNHDDLTHRQLDVLRLIAKGLRNKQIAERLKIAEDTVKQHARAAYGVLGVSSRTQAMSAVSRRGIRFD